MRVFLSHSSKQKPLVREIRACLPAFLVSWLDEENLLFGDDIPRSIAATIKSDTDYVLLFLDSHAAKSPWVRKEISWALETEKMRSRTILLPIVVEEGAIEALGNVELQARKYLQLRDYQEVAVQSLGRSIADSLFALICRDMQRLHHPDRAVDRLVESDTHIKMQATLIHKIVFPHRRSNPIAKEKLLEVINTQNTDALGVGQLETILAAIAQRNLIPGFNYDGFAAYLVEEHAQWKGELHHDRKERIGRRAAELVQNGMKVILDAGSTIEELAQVICKRIETRSLTRLTVATTSVNIADMLSDCCVRMGFDDDYSAVTLLIPGGRIRPNTQAIVPIMSDGTRDVADLARLVGGFDLCFVGVNGIDRSAGLTTHANAEAANKRHLLSVSRRRIIMGDASKIGIVLEECFARFDDDIAVIIDDDPMSDDVVQLRAAVGEKLMLA